MPILAKGGGGGEFIPAPAGVHQAVCVDVIDMGLLEVTFGGKTKTQHKVRVLWQIDEDMPDGRRFLVQKRYTLSLNEKATLRKDLESWRGKPFTDADVYDGFDLEKLIGVNALLNVIHAEKGGRTFANVASVAPLAKRMTKIEPKGYERKAVPAPEVPGDDYRDDIDDLSDIPF
jgi:hypothetical protein